MFLNFKHFSLSVLKLLTTRAGIHKMLARIANRKEPDKTARIYTFWQETSIQNFRTPTRNIAFIYTEGL